MGLHVEALEKQRRGGHAQRAALRVRRELQEPELLGELGRGDGPPQAQTRRQDLREAPEVDHALLGVQAL